MFIDELLKDNIVQCTDEYNRKESFWLGTPSDYHTKILRAGILISKESILKLYPQARGLFFLPQRGLRKYTDCSVSNIIISLYKGYELVQDDSVYFGMKWEKK